MQKDEILKQLMECSNGMIIHEGDLSIIDGKIFSKNSNEELNANDLSYLEYAKIFLNINNKKSIILALNIAIKLVTDDKDASKELIKNCLESIENSNDFSDMEKLIMQKLAIEKLEKL